MLLICPITESSLSPPESEEFCNGAFHYLATFSPQNGHILVFLFQRRDGDLIFPFDRGQFLPQVSRSTASPALEVAFLLVLTLSLKKLEFIS
ncbi:hypothetical protein TNCV_989791 [Trichonephila clavipes]|nr:hypothetical protein TNCV_989791 [Trichonephila clavipes]